VTDTTVILCSGVPKRIEISSSKYSMCVNSDDNAAKSCKNLVDFSPVTPELTQLNCTVKVDRHYCQYIYIR